VRMFESVIVCCMNYGKTLIVVCALRLLQFDEIRIVPKRREKSVRNILSASMSPMRTWCLESQAAKFVRFHWPYQSDGVPEKWS
jgi:hypothetical protein